MLWVLAVKRGEAFRGGGPDWLGSDTIGGDSALGFVIGLVLDIVVSVVVALVWETVIDRTTTWKVGVLRYERRSWRWRSRIIHRERLRRQESPEAALAELVAQVRAGQFD